jgi:hypothetical protein
MHDPQKHTLCVNALVCGACYPKGKINKEKALREINDDINAFFGTPEQWL